jgi:hypothetical protein
MSTSWCFAIPLRIILANISKSHMKNEREFMNGAKAPALVEE